MRDAIFRWTLEDPVEWMRRLFSDEYCAECNGDEEDHDAIIVMGNWFARCKTGEDT